MSCYFTNIFVHPAVIPAVCYFSVYADETQGGNQHALICSMARAETLEKGVKYVQI